MVVSSKLHLPAWLNIVLLLLILIDLGHSFYQHFHMSIGGDIAQIVVPTEEKGYYHVLHDPLGIRAITTGEKYPNPNRFFAHWLASKYFLYVPVWLQTFVSPLDSIYLSCALIKTLTQGLLLYLMAVLVSGTYHFMDSRFLLATVLITPLFQTWGFNRFMGLIDQSVIYTFFYAVPQVLLLLFFLPYFRLFYGDSRLEGSRLVCFLMVLLGYFIAFNGPLLPGVVVTICASLYLFFWWRRDRHFRRIFFFSRPLKTYSKYWIIPLVALGFFSLYSLYLGSYNSMNDIHELPVLLRYASLPSGLWEILTTKLALPLLLVFLGGNLVIIRRRFPSKGKRVLLFSQWALLFTIFYLLLLPLGGYRIYRPNIVRYDTIMPFTVLLFLLYGLSTTFLIGQLKGIRLKSYVLLVVIISLIYWQVDGVEMEKYLCERESLALLQYADEDIVVLPADCPVMEFRVVEDYQHSDLKADLLYRWGLTDTVRLFYQEDQE